MKVIVQDVPSLFEALVSRLPQQPQRLFRRAAIDELPYGKQVECFRVILLKSPAVPRL